jgi:disulfide oxidoreductase YuzD
VEKLVFGLVVAASDAQKPANEIYCDHQAAIYRKYSQQTPFQNKFVDSHRRLELEQKIQKDGCIAQRINSLCRIDVILEHPIVGPCDCECLDRLSFERFKCV